MRKMLLDERCEEMTKNEHNIDNVKKEWRKWAKQK